MKLLHIIGKSEIISLIFVLYKQQQNKVKQNIMNAQQLLQITQVFDYGNDIDGGYALEHKCSLYFINIAIDKTGNEVEFEVYVNNVAVVYSDSDKRDILNVILSQGENLIKEEYEEQEPYERDWMEEAKALKEIA